MVLARRGLRETESGNERIPDDAEAAGNRRRARTVWMKTALLIAVGTAIALVV